MKKILNLILPLLAVLLIISCSDDDKTAPSVVGTWKFTGTNDYVTDVFIPADPCVESLITFHKNGNGITTSADLCNLSIITPSEFTWQKEENNNYSITTSDETTTVTINFEGNNKLIISLGDDSSTVYERK